MKGSIMEKVVNSPRKIRRNLDLNQKDFWSKIGVTQSGGSRYENGRNMSKPVRELLRLVHVEGLDLQSIKRTDIEVLNYLKSQDEALFKVLKIAAKKQLKNTAVTAT
jgi:predicted transcriptional regulator